MSTPAPSRPTLRRAMRARRRGLSPIEQRRSALAVLHRVLRAAWFRRARRIGFYVADDGELDPHALLRAVVTSRRSAYLPTLPGVPATLRFTRANSSTLVPRRFGIPAPRGRAMRVERLELLFVPLVAFDRNGARLGRGGGFYDRALAARPGARRPLCVGLAHGFQEVERLPVQPWDVHLHMIVTPNEIIRARARQHGCS